MKRILLTGAAALVLGGCTLVFDAAVEDDANTDTSSDADPVDNPADASRCEQRQFIYLAGACSVSANTRLDLLGAGTYTFDTDSLIMQTPGGGVPINVDTRMTRGGTPIAVVSALGIVIGLDATLEVTGSLPLVLLSAGDIEILGKLDARSTESRRGPGVTDESNTACGASTGGNGTLVGSSRSGGGGGGFGSAGGQGGKSGPAVLADGGQPGTAHTLPDDIEPGCPGGDGGSIGQAPAGGDGGGAVALLAMGSIQVSGTILAGGDGGGGMDGGAGGGAGGLIAFDASAYVLTGTTVISAGGGGGGGGGGGDRGNDGGDQVASGGPATSPDGIGGLGGFISPLGQDGFQSSSDLDGAGGGGGGSAGFVLFADAVPALNQARVAPTADIIPRA